MEKKDARVQGLCSREEEEEEDCEVCSREVIRDQYTSVDQRMGVEMGHAVSRFGDGWLKTSNECARPER